MRLVSREIFRGVHHLRFGSDVDMCRALLRFQEFWENPRFRGKPFTREEYLRWYGRAFHGPFDEDSWSGCAFPSSAVEAFRDGRFDPDRAELQVLGALPESGKFFVIASAEDGTAVDHELAHSFYYLDRSYKKRADAVVEALRRPTRAFLLAELGGLCYGPRRLKDEAQAYLLDGLEPFLKLSSGSWSRQMRADFRRGSEGMRRLFRECCRGRVT
jgi:hypothetical protein